MPPKVKDLLTNRLDKTVCVKADSRAKYEKVVDVVDNLRAAGVDQLGLITEQQLELNRPKPVTPPPSRKSPLATCFPSTRRVMRVRGKRAAGRSKAR